MVLGYWFIYIFDIKNYKNYFFITETRYDNSLYSNKLIYLFIFKKTCLFLITVGFITPVVKEWLIHIRTLVAAPALLVFHVSLIDRTMLKSTTEVLRKSLDGWLQTSDFSEEKIFPENTWNFKGPALHQLN